MTILVWDDTSARTYESGVERGVLYPSDGSGVPWNGLLQITDSLNGGDRTAYAKEGRTYLQSVAARDYQATVQALSAPKEFSPYIGDLEVLPGFILTRQPRGRFGFSYRTLIADIGYKIHLVYNVTASPTSRSHASTNDTPTPVDLEWRFDAVPVRAMGYRPSAHYIVDSTRIDSVTLSSLEDILYGTDDSDPYLPIIDDLVALIEAAGGA